MKSILVAVAAAGIAASGSAGAATTIRRRNDPRVSVRSPPQSRDRRDRRVSVLDRFPFTLVQIKAEEIVILALPVTSRNPGYWSRRR